MEEIQLSPDELYAEISRNYQEFREKVDEFNKSTTKCKDAIARYEEVMDKYSAPDEETQRTISARRAEIEGMTYYLPKQNNLLLTLFVGDFNVVLPRKEDKIKYKLQYEKFKLFYIIGQLVFSSLNILCGPNRIVEGLLQFYLVWFYCNLTMKESILIANGSRIRTWWQVQHYIDILLYALLLIRADGDFSLQFSLYIFYMSGCQVLQFYYQAGSLYKMRALGRATHMEVSAEGLRVKTYADLQFLSPFFVLLYIFQFYNGYTLFYLAPNAREDERWEVYVNCALFISISLGNLFTLIHVVILKHQIHKLVKSPELIRRNLSNSLLSSLGKEVKSQ
ncbi:ion channel TACAN-like [Bolinopsis microptera]|uniref:ion channel TACAN-like n=1 Tax=Bolinopsis microptera TaxID=2820187 RepID=UPI00307A5B8D